MGERMDRRIKSNKKEGPIMTKLQKEIVIYFYLFNASSHGLIELFDEAELKDPNFKIGVLKFLQCRKIPNSRKKLVLRVLKESKFKEVM